MYARQVEGTLLTFGVSGKLIMNGLVMYDDETDTLWSQVLGEAVRGPLNGTALEVIPSTQTTWATWRELHPDTLVLEKNGGYRSDPYARYYTNRDTGILGETNKDRRLYIKEYVVGVSLGQRSKAYPFSVLNDIPVVNDVIGGRPVLVVFDPESATGIVYDRTVSGRPLDFSLLTIGSGPDFLIQDEETGSRWRALTGEAIDGELAGASLVQLPSTYVFWFGWTDFHPDTELFSG